MVNRSGSLLAEKDSGSDFLARIAVAHIGAMFFVWSMRCISGKSFGWFMRTRKSRRTESRPNLPPCPAHDVVVAFSVRRILLCIHCPPLLKRGHPRRERAFTGDLFRWPRAGLSKAAAGRSQIDPDQSLEIPFSCHPPAVQKEDRLNNPAAKSKRLVGRRMKQRRTVRNRPFVNFARRRAPWRGWSEWV